MCQYNEIEIVVVDLGLHFFDRTVGEREAGRERSREREREREAGREREQDLQSRREDFQEFGELKSS